MAEKLYHVTYRDEFMVTVQASNAQDAEQKAFNGHDWEFIQDSPHSDFVVVEPADINLTTEQIADYDRLEQYP